MKRILAGLVLLVSLGIFTIGGIGRVEVGCQEPEKKNEAPKLPDAKKDGGAKKFPRGAKPTPKHKIFAAPRHKPIKATLPWVAYVPKQLNMWGNDSLGDCVTAEEGYNKACSTQGGAEIYIDPTVLIAWAKAGGFADGANLTDVMDAMVKKGFVQNGNTYGDGAYTSVDYTDESILQNAIDVGPVKIGIDADALPSGAGQSNGWYALGGTQKFTNEDHCVSLGGHGTATQLFQALGVPLPSGLPGATTGYLLYTWSTLGFVDHTWIMSTVGEAWLRNPCTTVNGTAIPNPGLPGSAPAITSAATATATTGQAFSYQITASNSPTSYVASGLPQGLMLNATSGLINGTVALAGVSSIGIGATNVAGTGTSVLTLTVTGAPTPPAPTGLTVSVPAVSSAPGAAVTFTPMIAGGTAPYAQAWQFGDGSCGMVPTHTYPTAGSFTATLTVTDSSQPPLNQAATAIVTVGTGPAPTTGPTVQGPKGDAIGFPAGWLVVGHVDIRGLKDPSNATLVQDFVNALSGKPKAVNPNEPARMPVGPK